MKRAGLILVIIAALCTAGCTVPQYVEPTVTVDGISIQRVTLGSIDLEVRLIVSNPNPVGATLEEISFDLYFLDGGQQRFLAHGEHGEFAIRPAGDTTIAIPVTVDNLRLVQAFILALQDGEVTFRVSGSAPINLGVITYDVPFNRTLEVAFPARQ